MSGRPRFNRRRRDLKIQAGIGVAVVLAIFVWSPGVERRATDSGSTEAVVDPAELLTEGEREFLTNAVIDVRERTPYYATILVADRLAGRSPDEIAEQALTVSAPEGQLDAILVLVPGAPPTAALALPGGSVEDLPVTDARPAAGDDAQAAAVTQGVSRAGLAFTSRLIQGPPPPEAGR